MNRYTFTYTMNTIKGQVEDLPNKKNLYAQVGNVDIVVTADYLEMAFDRAGDIIQNVLHVFQNEQPLTSSYLNLKSVESIS